MDKGKVNRVLYLDGIRGIAIIWVVLYHAYSRYAYDREFLSSFQDLPIISYGYLGVPLFLILSGYVIFLTIDNSKGFGVFIFKRWLRLWPSIAFISLFIYFTSELFPLRPMGEPTLYSLISGLTLIQDGIWKIFFPNEQVILEGAFWSIFLEFKFYLFIGIIYFYLGRRFVFPAIFFVFCLYLFSVFLYALWPGSLSFTLLKLNLFLGTQYFSWFLVGVLFFLAKSESKDNFYFYGGVIGILGSVSCYAVDYPSYELNLDIREVLYCLLVTFLFLMPICCERIRPFFEFKILRWFGFISFPLYLIHENMIVSISEQIYRYKVGLPTFLIVVISILFSCLLSYLIAKYIEPLLRMFILKAKNSLWKS